MKTKWSNNVKFHPWIGNQYTKNKCRILILGESHYDWLENGKKQRASGSKFTIGYIDGLTNPDTRSEKYKNKGTWTKFEKAIIRQFGKGYDEAGIKTLWHSVCFYNFVQKSVSDGARVSPKSTHFKKSIAAFDEVISNLKPHVIIALGMRLWKHLPDGLESKSFITDGRTTETIIYNYPNGHCMAFPIYHPSAGFNPEHWSKVIKKGINCGNRS